MTRLLNLGLLLGMSLAMLLALLAFSSFAAVAPLLRAEWGLTNTQIGMVFAVYLVGYALAALVVVPLTDRVAPARVLLASLALLVAGNLAFPLLAHDFAGALVIRLFTGAGQVGFYMPGIRLIAQRFPAEARGLAVGSFVAAGYGGTTLSYTLTGLLLARMSWREAYLSAALLGVPAFLLVAWLLRREFSVSSTMATAARGPGRLDWRVLRERDIVLAVAAYALHTAELYLARLWFPLLLGALFVERGLDVEAATARAATWAGFMFMMGMGAVLAGGLVSDRIGRTWGGALIFAGSGVCSLLAGWLVAAPPVFLITLGFFYGILTAADSAIYLTAALELSPPARVGSVQALGSFVGFSAGALVPVLAGGMLDVGGASSKWLLAFGLNGLLAMAGVAALLCLRRLPEAVRLAGGKR